MSHIAFHALMLLRRLVSGSNLVVSSYMYKPRFLVLHLDVESLNLLVAFFKVLFDNTL